MNKAEYPVMLNVEHVMEILGVSKRRAYEIMDIESFPLIRLGRSKRVQRDRFFEWLDEQASSKSVR